MEYHSITLCGLTRKLPIAYVSRSTRIASFTLLGDIELVDRLTDVFVEELRDVSFDYVVCPEVKIVPLVHVVAKTLGQKRFAVCRKSIKPYMVSPTVLKPLPKFPKHVKSLVINGPDATLLSGKRVVIIDDVVSTGVTMRMTELLMEQIGATVVKKMVVLRQGEQSEKITDLISLANLPLFSS